MWAGFVIWGHCTPWGHCTAWGHCTDRTLQSPGDTAQPGDTAVTGLCTDTGHCMALGPGNTAEPPPGPLLAPSSLGQGFSTSGVTHCKYPSWQCPPCHPSLCHRGITHLSSQLLPRQPKFPPNSPMAALCARIHQSPGCGDKAEQGCVPQPGQPVWGEGRG